MGSIPSLSEASSQTLSTCLSCNPMFHYHRRTLIRRTTKLREARNLKPSSRMNLTSKHRFRDAGEMRSLLIAIFLCGAQLWAGEKGFLKGEFIFPTETWHNHASCIVEARNGDLIVCWFHGSGERTADDVKILGARLRKGETRWSEPFVMADTADYPDTNCAMFIDPQERLWLLWPTILANR